MSLSSIEHNLIYGILLNMHCVKREWHSWSSPWLCKWGILVGSYEWQDSGGGCWVGRHPPILTSEQRAGDLTRRFPLPRGGPCLVGSLHTSYKLHVQLYKDLSCQHAFGQRCTKITGFEETLLDGSLFPEVGLVGSLHTIHVKLYN